MTREDGASAPSSHLPMSKTIPIQIIEAIDAGYEAQRKKEERRRYIGASIIGKNCDAFLALSLRSYPDNPLNAKALRIFSLGHEIEAIVVRDLKRAKVHVIDRDPRTGKQWRYVDYGGHVMANLDGQMELETGEPATVEIKSMNETSFKKFTTLGVKTSHPDYYRQVQMGMGMSGIRKCVFIAYSKNTSEYHVELVEFDPFEWSHLKTRIERVLSNDAEKIAETENWSCQWCSKSDVCWGRTEPAVECTSCVHALPAEGGTWYCSFHGREAKESCKEYEKYMPREKTR